MAGASTKNYNAAQIQRSPADLWLSLAAPVSPAHIITLDEASGTPDATANPTAAHCGLLEVPSILTYTPKVDFEMVDQDTNAVAAFMNTEEAMFEATMSQLDFTTVLAKFMPAGGFTGASPAMEGITLGQGADILTAPQCIAIIAPSVDSTYKWVVGVLYKAVLAAAVKITVGRSKTATYQVQFRGLSDLTRPSGDRIGSIYKTA